MPDHNGSTHFPAEEKPTTFDWRELPANEPAPPAQLTRHRLATMPAAEREAHDAARRAHHKQLVLSAPVVRHAVTRGRGMLAANRRLRPSERPFLEITGPAGTGKTVASLELERAVWRTDLARNPVRGLDNRITALSIAVPPAADLYAVVQSVAYATFPPEFVRDDEPLERLAGPPLHVLNQAGVSMVVIDHAEHLAPSAAAAHAALHWLVDRLPTATFVYVTRAPAEQTASGPATTSSGRRLPNRVAAVPLTYGPDWQQLLATADTQLRLLDHAPGTLASLDRQLHQATGGLVGVLGPALRAAAADAVGTTEHVGWEALEHALLDS